MKFIIKITVVLSFIGIQLFNTATELKTINNQEKEFNELQDANIVESEEQQILKLLSFLEKSNKIQHLNLNKETSSHKSTNTREEELEKTNITDKSGKESKDKSKNKEEKNTKKWWQRRRHHSPSAPIRTTHQSQPPRHYYQPSRPQSQQSRQHSPSALIRTSHHYQQSRNHYQPPRPEPQHSRHHYQPPQSQRSQIGARAQPRHSTRRRNRPMDEQYSKNNNRSRQPHGATRPIRTRRPVRNSNIRNSEIRHSIIRQPSRPIRRRNIASNSNNNQGKSNYNFVNESNNHSLPIPLNNEEINSNQFQIQAPVFNNNSPVSQDFNDNNNIQVLPAFNPYIPNTSQSKSEQGGNTNSEKSNSNLNNSENYASHNRSGYSTSGNVSLLGGRYSFDLEKGSRFCAENCKPDNDEQAKKCYKGEIKDCRSCEYKGNVRTPRSQDATKLCKKACNALVGTNTCDFYSFINTQKKIINRTLLNRFGLDKLKKLLLKL